MFAGERWIKIVAKRYAGPRSECVKLRSRPRSCDDTALFGRKTQCFFPPSGKKKKRCASPSCGCARPRCSSAVNERTMTKKDRRPAWRQMQMWRAAAGAAAERSRHTVCKGKRKILEDWTRCLLLRSTHGRYTGAGGPAARALYQSGGKVEQSLGSINPHHFQKK